MASGVGRSLIKPRGLFGDAFKHRAKDILSARFIVPPFSVLNTREGWWQERKRQWIDTGIKSELGRGFTEAGIAYGSSLGKSGELNTKYRNAVPGHPLLPAMNHAGRKPGAPIVRGDGRGRPLIRPASKEPDESTEPIGGTSVFDPVLCELVYRWFCGRSGHVLDPFAGGSVRGIVAACLGLKYTGVELSKRQVEANLDQTKTLFDLAQRPFWINGDSMDIIELVKPLKTFDLLFSCPPYGDLERYSDDPRDLSSMPLERFRATYRAIIERCCLLLAPNSFAVFVVGDYRDKDGYYCNLAGETVAAFEAAGLRLYNWAVLVNVTGSLPLRINNQFVGSRKLGKTHQDVLVFAKGNPKEFVPTWGPLEI